MGESTKMVAPKMSSNKSLISIIVPIYQVQDYIVSCLASIRKQTYSNFQVILIDDGSTDLSGKLARSFADDDARFEYHFQENGGVSAALNSALRHVRGEYITFVDPDDQIAPDYLSLLLKAIEMHGTDVACCNFPSGTDRVFQSKDYWRQFLRNQLCSVSRWAKLFRAVMFANYRFPVGEVAEDVHCAVSLFRGDITLYAFDANLYVYQYRATSYTHNHSEKHWASIIRQWLFMFAFFCSLFSNEESELRFFPINNAMEYFVQFRNAFPASRLLHYSKKEICSAFRRAPFRQNLRQLKFRTVYWNV